MLGGTRGAQEKAIREVINELSEVFTETFITENREEALNAGVKLYEWCSVYRNIELQIEARKGRHLAHKKKHDSFHSDSEQ